MRLILMAFLLMPATVFCQQLKKEVSFGKVTKEELLNNTCDFDKDAEAVGEHSEA